MATTGFWPVKGRLKDVINYAENPDKTIDRKYLDDDLAAALNYVENSDKTDQTMYVSGINCPKKRAYEAMMTTKRRYGKLGGNVAYHGYQSFRTGEVTAEEAHRIGIETAQRMWGKDYEVVVTTHLNTDNLHNHIIVNSVSFRTGRKFENHISDHYKLREISDAVCREHGKSILEDAPFYSKSKKLYWIEKSGQPTHRDILRQDIDEAIAHSYKESMFIYYLESIGYEFVRGYDYQHPSVKAPSWQRPIRINSLGKEYTRNAINERLHNNLGRNLTFADFQAPPRNRKPLLILIQSNPRYREPDGFTIFFQLVVELFRLISGRPYVEVKNNIPISPEFRAIWKDLDKISEAAQFLGKHHIVTKSDFHDYENQIDDKIHELEGVRQKYRNKLRRVKSPEEETALKEKCKEITRQIMPYRKDKEICRFIAKRQPELKQAVERELQTELGTQRQKQILYRKDNER